MKQLKRAIAGAALLALSGAASALTFNFTFLAGTSAQAQQAFIDAGARWSALYSDNITLDIRLHQQHARRTPGLERARPRRCRAAAVPGCHWRTLLRSEIHDRPPAAAMGST